MGIRLFYISVIQILVIMLSCHKICKPRQFSFLGGVANVSPERDSIHVGDTLWLSSSIPVNFKYLGGSSDSIKYNLSGASNVITDIHLTSLVGINKGVGGVDSFSYLPATKGSVQTNPLAPHFAKTITYSQENDKYVFLFGVIAQKKGLYCLTIIDIYQAMKNCDKISVAITTNNIDSHLHYLRDYYGGGQINSLDSTHSYCFKVY